MGICQVLLDEGALCHGEPKPRVGPPGLAVLGSRHLGARRRWALRWAYSYPHGLGLSPPSHPGLCPAVKHDWTFQDRDTQFYRFPGPEPETVGIHELEEELVEAVALLSQRGPDALLTVALRKP